MRRRDHLRSASPLVLAAMLALAPQSAWAQAFQGTETVTFGNATRSIVTIGVENIAVSTPQAVINWAPGDTAIGGGPIDFLPAGNIVNFSSPVGLPYTVLNRIIAADPARAIALNGAVNSDSIGNIWFYAPGGLLLGGTARFDVGGLLLTANDPVPGSGGAFIGAANDFRLAVPSGSTAGVTIAAGAQIASNSYMIAVAPRITMAGAATVGTSAALVMAEDVSFTLNGGLFDITANIGTAAGGTSTVSGSITGPGGISGQGAFSRIYMMAVPRNDAMTLLITGGAQLGFDVANAADVDGNAVVLSGGYDVTANPFVFGTSQFADAPVAGSDAGATITVEAGSFTSGVVVRSKDVAQVVARSGDITAAGNVDVFADGEALIGASTGHTLQAVGRLVADASTPFGLQLGQSRTAGLAEVAARTGGSVIAGGDIVAVAIGAGDFAASPGQPGASGTGGTARILAEGAGSRIEGLSFIADASGRAGSVIDGNGGSGIGGSAEIRFDTGTLISVAGDLGVYAVGSGDAGSDGRASGNAQGGTATLTLGNGVAVDLQGGFLLASANADYGEGGFTSHLGGGTAQAGTATVTLGDGATLRAGLANVSATAFGSQGTGRNDFIGGTAAVRLDDVGGATALTLDTLGIFANGEGGAGIAGAVIDGGSGSGGRAQLLATGNGRITTVGALTVAADGLGGDGADVSGGFIGAGANGSGGIALIDLTGGGLQVGDTLLVSADGIGGRGDAGGNGEGGAAGLRLGPGSLPNDPGIGAGTLTLSARAQGGLASQGATGNAQAGQAGLLVESGTVTAAALLVNVAAVGGAGALAGGNATAGTAILEARGGLLSAGDLAVTATALGGAGAPGGGVASGGTISLLASGGDIGVAPVTGLIRFDASAEAGDSSGPIGTATGGTMMVDAQGGSIDLGGDTQLLADARSSSFSGSFAGAASAGTIGVGFGSGGDISVAGNLIGSARADGLTANGGALQVQGAAGSLSVVGSLGLFADAAPGNLLDGVRAAGGTVELVTTAASTIDIRGDVDLAADAAVFGSGRNRAAQGGVVDWQAGGSGTVAGAIRLSANAAFANGPGGTATAGDVGLGVALGTLSGGGLFASANANAGFLDLGPAPAGTGGTVALATAAGASLAITGPVALAAEGVGGSLFQAAGPGGLGQGGGISIINAGAMTLNVGDLGLDVSATGTGGSSATDVAGLGRGGIITIDTLAGGSFTLDSAGIGPLQLDARGLGNSFSGLPGSVQGGAIAIANAGNVTLAEGLSLLVGGGLPGGQGALLDVVAGAASLTVSGGTSSIGGDLLLDGSSLVAFVPIGGTGRGGTLAVRVTGGTLDVAGALSLLAGGEGGSSGAAGGDGLGGAVDLTLAGGTLNAAGPITLAAFGLGGVGVTGGDGVAGQVAITIGAGNALVLGGGLVVDLAGEGGFGQSGPGGDGFGGSLLLSAVGGGLIESGGPLVWDAAGLGGNSNAGTGGAGSGGTLGLAADGAGSIIRLPGATLAASGLGGTGIAAGAGSGGAVILAAANAGLIDVTAPLVMTAQGADGAGTPGAAGLVQLLAQTGGTIALDTLDAQAIGTPPASGRSALVAGVGSSITIAGAGLVAASGDIGVNDGGSISAGGTLRIVTPGQLRTGLTGQTAGATGAVAAAQLELLGDAGIDLATGTAGSTAVAITSAAGAVRMGAIGATGTALINAATDVAIAADSAVGGAVAITAGGAVAIAGNLVSPDIAITSADIAISPGVTLGGANAQRIVLAANAAATSMLVGGAGSASSGVYGLSNAEFGTLRARSISVEMPRGPMTVDTLALPAIAPASAQDGITLFSAGPMRVTGAVTMAQAGAGNRLSLTSEDRIEVVQGSGSIVMGADADNPVGELDLNAESIRIASDALLAQIASGSLAGAARDAALNGAAPVNAPGGSIAAGTIRLGAGSDLLIQNSGSLAVPAGFTAGIGGLSVSAFGSGLLDMVINGRIARRTGGFATGADTLALVQYQPDINAMAASSQVNGCNIFSLCPTRGPLQDAIITVLTSVEPLTPEEYRDRGRQQASTPALPLQVIQGLYDFGPLFRDVDATDPATSTGNPALWRDPASPSTPSGGQE